MQELLHQLGINWRLFLAQVANFLLLLLILRLTVYKPLLALLKERRTRIEQGLKDAETAGRRLAEADSVKAMRLREAETEAIALLKETERKSKELEGTLLAAAREKEANILAVAKRQAEAMTAEERGRFFGEAAGLVRRAIEKVAGASPREIDERLIAQAVAALKKEQ